MPNGESKDIDTCITSALRAGHDSTCAISCFTIAALGLTTGRSTSKRIQGRLQAMRRRGAICHVGDEWSLISPPRPTPRALADEWKNGRTRAAGNRGASS